MPRVLRDSRTENTNAGSETNARQPQAEPRTGRHFSDSSAPRRKVAGESHGCLPENHTSQEAQRPRDLGAPRDPGLGLVRNYTALRCHWDRSLGKNAEDNSHHWRTLLLETNGGVYMRCEDNESPNREPMFPRGRETSFGSFLCSHRRFPPRTRADLLVRDKKWPLPAEDLSFKTLLPLC